MANSTFSNLSDRASGALSGLRNRFGGGSRDQDRYEDEYDDDYGYDEDDGYDNYRDYGDYGEYGYEPDEPYDDYTGSQDIGEIRTRSVPSSPRSHPPLVSFNEARTNTYVPDHLMRDPLEHIPPRGARYSGGRYTPRIRNSVNVGHAAEYDFASVGGAQIDESGVEVPQVEVSKQAPSPSGYDPYASYRGEGESSHTPSRQLKILAPTNYGDVESIARALKAGDVVVLDLAQTSGDLAKRVLDFSFGVASALDARVDCIADKVFIICRGEGLTLTERGSLRIQGILH